ITLKAEPQAWNPEERAHYRKEQKYWLASVITTALAVGFAGFSAKFAWDAVGAAQESVKVARDSGYYQSRANIILSDITTADSPETQKIGLIPKWENTGNVAANVKASIAYHFWEKEPPPYFFLNEGIFEFNFTLGSKEASSAIFGFLPKGC